MPCVNPLRARGSLKIHMMRGAILCLVLFIGHARAKDLFNIFPPVEVNGSVELRAGCRTQKDPNEDQISIMESRLQMELLTFTEWTELKYKADAWADGITEKGEFDTREAWLFVRASEAVDIKIGRQILTWGTGDLVFLNDLFPKDWQSYFIGRDSEYLKAPSDAIKFSFFNSMVNIDLIYTPQCDPDRYITGTYLSFWDGNGLVGRRSQLSAQRPDQWFKDDELALRLYKNIKNYELALYGYHGFWKQPVGQSNSGDKYFPGLSVFGFSARGKVAHGIGNLEFAYYRSEEDPAGTDALINNSELRYLLGYSQDLARDCNASLQYYVEQILDYDAYRNGLNRETGRDRFRQVITLQLTRLLMNQNLELSLSTYLCVSDKDAYLKPRITYKWTDDITVETGASIFTGDERYTFFGQFADNTSVYAALRYSF